MKSRKGRIGRVLEGSQHTGTRCWSEVVEAVGQGQVWFSVDALAHKEGQLMCILAGCRNSDDSLSGKREPVTELSWVGLPGSLPQQAEQDRWP